MGLQPFLEQIQFMELPQATINVAEIATTDTREFEHTLDILTNHYTALKQEKSLLTYDSFLKTLKRVVDIMECDPSDKMFVLLTYKTYDSLILDLLDNWLGTEEVLDLRTELMIRVLDVFEVDGDNFKGFEEKIIYVLENHLRNIIMVDIKSENDIIGFIGRIFSFYNNCPRIFRPLQKQRLLKKVPNLPSIAYTQELAARESPSKIMMCMFVLQLGSKIQVIREKTTKGNFPFFLLKPSIEAIVRPPLRSYENSTGVLRLQEYIKSDLHLNYNQSIRDYLGLLSEVEDEKLIALFVENLEYVLEGFWKVFNRSVEKHQRNYAVYVAYHFTIMLLMKTEDMHNTFKNMKIDKWETSLSPGMLFQAKLSPHQYNLEELANFELHEQFLRFIISIVNSSCPSVRSKYVEKVSFLNNEPNNDWIMDFMMTAFADRTNVVTGKFLEYAKYFAYNDTSSDGDENWTLKMKEPLARFILLRLELFFFYPKRQNVEFCRTISTLLIKMNSTCFIRSFEFKASFLKLRENIYSKREASYGTILESFKLCLSKITASIIKTERKEDLTSKPPTSGNEPPYDFFNYSLGFLDVRLLKAWVISVKLRMNRPYFSIEEFKANCSVYEELLLIIYCLDKSFNIYHPTNL